MPPPQREQVACPDPPLLCSGVHLGNLQGLAGAPRVRIMRRVTDHTLRELAELGINAVQSSGEYKVSGHRIEEAGLAAATSGSYRVFPGDRKLKANVLRWRDEGYRFATLLVGSALDNWDDMRRHTEFVLEVAEQTNFQLLIETHRGTMTQSPRRTLRLLEAFPELALNLDYSHWFFACRLGDLPLRRVIRELKPALRATRCMHGRVASEDEIQVPADDAQYLEHFLDVWTAAIENFDGQTYFFTELLGTMQGYARQPEASDRLADATHIIAALRKRVGGPDIRGN